MNLRHEMDVYLTGRKESLTREKRVAYPGDREKQAEPGRLPGYPGDMTGLLSYCHFFVVLQYQPHTVLIFRYRAPKMRILFHILDPVAP